MFPTVSHHIDTYSYEIALSLCNCEQVFLYPEAIAGRLLPFVQKTGVSSRQPLSLKISSFQFNTHIKKLKSTQKIQPKGSFKHKIYNFLKTKYSFSFVYLLLRKLRQN